MKSTMEKKYRSFTLANEAPIKGGGLDSGSKGFCIPNLYSVMPLQQGTNNQQRVGNDINVKKLNLRGFIKAEMYSTTNNSSLPFEVHLILYKAKKDPTGVPNYLKSLQNNTQGPITGQVANDMQPWNHDQYLIKKLRTWKFKSPPYATHTDIAGTSVTQPGFIFGSEYGSSTNVHFQRFSINVPTPKKLVFKDGSNVVENDWIGIGLWVQNGDGASIAATQVRASLYMDGAIYYTDP